jgi:hypothetical protein
MTVLNAAELSRLSRIAANPKRARAAKEVSLRDLQGHAREVARALLGDTSKVSKDAANTAQVLKSWSKK